MSRSLHLKVPSILAMFYVWIAIAYCLLVGSVIITSQSVDENCHAKKWNISADNLFQHVIEPTSWKNVMVVFDESSSYFALSLTHQLSQRIALTLTDIDATPDDASFEVLLGSAIVSPRKECHFLIFCNSTNTPLVVQKISVCRMRNNHSHLPDFVSKMFIFIENPPEDTLIQSAYNISNMAVFTYEMSFIKDVATLLWTKDGRQLSTVEPGCSKSWIPRLFPNIDLQLNGFQLTVTTLPAGTFVMKDVKNGTATYSGLCIEILDYLAKAYNFSYVITEPEDHTYGGVVNGRWTGLVGDLVRKDADLVATVLAIEADRHSVVDFTPSFFEEDFGLLIQNRKEFFVQSDIASAPFQWIVWLLIVIAIVTTSCLYAGVKCLSDQWRTSVITNCKCIGDTILETMWITFGSFIKQDVGNNRRYSVVSRTLFAFWSLFTIAIFSFYSSQLVAFLSVMKENFPFNNIKGLVSQNEYTWGSDCSDCVVTHVFERSTKPEFKQFLARMKFFAAEDANFFVIANQLKKVASEKHVSLVSYLVTGYDITFKTCETTLMDKGVLKFPSGFAVPKGSPLLKDFSVMMQHLDERGILAYLLMKWEAPQPVCQRNNIPQRITVSTMHSAGYTLFGGIFLSLTALIVEFVLIGRRSIFMKRHVIEN